MDLDALLKAAAPLTDSVKQADADRGAAVFEGRAGGGAVTVRLNGLLVVQQVRIAPAAAAAAAADISMLEDLVAAAVGDALRLYRQRFGATAEEQTQKLMAGADLSTLLKAFTGPR